MNKQSVLTLTVVEEQLLHSLWQDRICLGRNCERLKLGVEKTEKLINLVSYLMKSDRDAATDFIHDFLLRLASADFLVSVGAATVQTPFGVWNLRDCSECPEYTVAGQTRELRRISQPRLP